MSEFCMACGLSWPEKRPPPLLLLLALAWLLGPPPSQKLSPLWSLALSLPLNPPLLLTLPTPPTRRTCWPSGTLTQLHGRCNRHAFNQ